jgi:hypothetical protein
VAESPGTAPVRSAAPGALKKRLSVHPGLRVASPPAACQARRAPRGTRPWRVAAAGRRVAAALRDSAPRRRGGACLAFSALLSTGNACACAALDRGDDVALRCGGAAVFGVGLALLSRRGKRCVSSPGVLSLDVARREERHVCCWTSSVD